MNLIHIADTHLGLAAFNRLDPESGMNLREKQVYDNFLSAIDVIIRQKPDVLVHAGYLFDVVRPKTRAYTTVLEALDRLHAAGIHTAFTIPHTEHFPTSAVARLHRETFTVPGNGTDAVCSAFTALL